MHHLKAIAAGSCSSTYDMYSLARVCSLEHHAAAAELRQYITHAVTDNAGSERESFAWEPCNFYLSDQAGCMRKHQLRLQTSASAMTEMAMFQPIFKSTVV